MHFLESRLLQVGEGLSLCTPPSCPLRSHMQGSAELSVLTLHLLPFSIPTAPALGQAPFTSHLEHFNSRLAGLQGSYCPPVQSILHART